MINVLNLTLAWRRSIVAAAGALAIAGVAVNASAAETSSPSGTYKWSAELVAFDRANGMMTVKSAVVGHAELTGLKNLERGDRAILTWSGVFDASGIRSIRPGETADSDRFSMPVEFVSSEMDNRYIVFRVPVPQKDAAAIEALPAGSWVTATSPHHPSNPSEAVASVRPYNDVE